MELERILKSEEKILTLSALQELGDGQFMPLLEKYSKNFNELGYEKLKLGPCLQEMFLVKEEDISHKKMTACVQVYTETTITEELAGVERIQVPGKQKVGDVLLDGSLIIGDELMKNITKKEKPSLIKKIFKGSILDESLIGVYHGLNVPTIQRNGGANKLGLHNEHHGAKSGNLLHHGEPKIWHIIPPNLYKTALKKIAQIESRIDMKDFFGECEGTVDHRDIYYVLEKLGIKCSIVIQVAGELILVNSFGLHEVKNEGMNLAESQNYLSNEDWDKVASCKVCTHSQFIDARPAGTILYGVTEQKFKDGSLPLPDYIHDSDPEKRIKLESVLAWKREGNRKKMKRTIEAIKFKSLMDSDLIYKQDSPNKGKKEQNALKAKKVRQVQKIGKIGKDYRKFQRFYCKICPYVNKQSGDMRNHYLQKHNKVIDAPLGNCPRCMISTSQLNTHLNRPICIKRARNNRMQRRIRRRIKF